MKLDLNCDLGEGESWERTETLMSCITSANIACGGHAGNVSIMEACVALAKSHGVLLGAHPGVADRSFGRSNLKLSSRQLESLLLEQVTTLERIARRHGMRLHHVKLHGALYHATETDARLRRCYLTVLAHRWPNVRIYALAGGKVVAAARRRGIKVWEEAFADRGYADNGKLIPRGQPDALLHRIATVRQRAVELLHHQRVVSVTGRLIKVTADTICVHADTPQAVKFARAISELLHLSSHSSQWPS